ncbi:MAG: DUF748 domain-containing protein [Halioglobus sp.]
MRTVLRVLTMIYMAYLAVALLIIMPALNIVPAWYMQQAFGRQLQTDIVLFNPFTLNLEVRNAALPERDGTRFTGLTKASVNLSMESLWHQGWVFDAVRVEGLYAYITRLSEDKFNFSDMLGSAAEEPPQDATATNLPGLTIHEVELHSETIVLTDQSREKPYTSNWNEMAVSVQGLSTVMAEGKPYRIDLYGPGGGSLHWEGELSIPNAHSEGSLALSNLDLTVAWRFAEPWVNFELLDGRLSIQGQYQLDWQEALRYQLSEGQLSVSVIDIAPKPAVPLPDTALGLKDLTVAGISVDSDAQHAVIESITVDDLSMAGWREGSRVSLSELFAVAVAEDPNATIAPDPLPDNDTDNSGWTAQIKSTQMHSSSLHWRSEFTDPSELAVTPIEAAIGNINWPLSGDSPFSLKLTTNGQAVITIDGSLALASGDGTIGYSLQGLPLVWFNPNFPRALKAQLTGGHLEVAGEVALTGFAPATVQMEGAIEDFSIKIEDAETALTNWDSVRLEGLAVNLDEQSLVLRRLAIHNYSGRVHIRKDGSINMQNVWREEVGEKAEEIAEDLTRDKPWSIDIPTITVTDSAIDFMDQSLPIQFRTVIGELNGEVLGISTTAGAVAKVNMQGSVDGYAPVVLKGTVEPFNEQTTLDLKLTFDGVDLALLSPYSSTYAGYAIDRGLLNLRLNYLLKNNSLEGHNDVVIDQLKLGDKIASEKAVDLPLKLALALLTDANGVIDMQVPVSGNVDDPKFDVGSVIFKAFINIITKAVTAPFTLLASLVSSEEDLQRLTFASGAAELNAANTAKLGQLTQALTQRPKLTLVIIGRINVPADRERLQKNQLKKELVAAGLSQADVDSKNGAWENAIMQRYAALPENEKQETELTPLEFYQRVTASIAVTDAQLLELAEQRAVAVKAYLVNEAGLSADRAVVEKSDLNDEANSFSGVELTVDG